MELVLDVGAVVVVLTVEPVLVGVELDTGAVVSEVVLLVPVLAALARLAGTANTPAPQPVRQQRAAAIVAAEKERKPDEEGFIRASG